MSRERKESTMQLVKRISLCVFILCIAGMPALAGGDVQLLFGKKGSSESRFDSTDAKDQAVTGVMLNLDFEKPVVFAVDLLFSSEDGTRTVGVADPLVFVTDVATTELDLGVRKLFNADRKVQPYVGAGLAWIELDVLQTVSGSLGVPGSEFTDTILDDNDSAFGFWADAGVRFR